MFCCSFNFLSFKHTFEERKKQQQHHTVRGFSGVTDVRVKKCVSFTTFTNSFSHWKLWEPQPPFLVLDESMLNVAILFLITLTWITYSIVTLHVFLSLFLFPVKVIINNSEVLLLYDVLIDSVSKILFNFLDGFKFTKQDNLLFYYKN